MTQIEWKLFLIDFASSSIFKIFRFFGKENIFFFFGGGILAHHFISSKDYAILENRKEFAVITLMTAAGMLSKTTEIWNSCQDPGFSEGLTHKHLLEKKWKRFPYWRFFCIPLLFMVFDIKMVRKGVSFGFWSWKWSKNEKTTRMSKAIMFYVTNILEQFFH